MRKSKALVPEVKKKDCRKTIYYDGSCNMCNSIIKKIDNSSQKEKFNQKDITKDTLPQNISRSELEKEIHVVDASGKIYKNAEAILKILEEYPKWKFIVRVGRLPIIKQLLPIGYKFIASHRHSVFLPKGTNGLNKLIIFMFVYILIVFPLALFTDDIFPFSRFPMYAQNSLYPCGYQSRLYKNDQGVTFYKSQVASLFLKNFRDVIVKHGSFTTEMCEFIHQVFWPQNIPQQAFFVKSYCADIEKLPSLKFDESIVLVCS